LYLILRPHNSSKLNFIDAIMEMIFIAIHSLILILGADDSENFIDDDVRYDIGWLIIGLSLSVLIIEMGIMLHEQVVVLKTVWKNIKKYRQRKAEKKRIRLEKIRKRR